MTVHPIYLVRRHEQQVESGHYRRIGEATADAYRTRLTQVDPYHRIAQLAATKARLADHATLIRTLVGHAVGLEDITNDEALAILIGWATSEGRRWNPTERIHPRRNTDLDDLQGSFSPQLDGET